jgi:hypothetical protein
MATEPKSADYSEIYKQKQGSCNGFAQAVAATFGVNLIGDANTIIGDIVAPKNSNAPKWRKLTTLAEVQTAVRSGKLVIAALAGKDHHPPRTSGHLAIVVDGPLYRGKYPRCWAGSTNARWGKSDGTLSVGECWNPADRDSVGYYTTIP